MRNPDSIPAPIRELLNIKALGTLDGFRDCLVINGEIRLNNGQVFTADKLIGLIYVYQELAALRRRVKHQEDKIARLRHNRDHWRSLSQHRAANDEY